MNADELLKFVQGEHQVRKGWMINAERMRHNAKVVEEVDPILAILLRRLALSIEQYMDRIQAHVEVKRLEEQDEVEAEVAALFAKVMSNVGKKEQP
jgi:hypothetical protein